MGAVRGVLGAGEDAADFKPGALRRWVDTGGVEDEVLVVVGEEFLADEAARCGRGETFLVGAREPDSFEVFDRFLEPS